MKLNLDKINLSNESMESSRSIKIRNYESIESSRSIKVRNYESIESSRSIKVRNSYYYASQIYKFNIYEMDIQNDINY